MRFSLTELFADLPPIQVVDVGASALQGEGPAPYQPLIDVGKARIVGFEPDPEQFRILEEKKLDYARYLPWAIGDGRPGVLHICRAPGMTSLLEPDREVLDHFQGFSQWSEVIRRESISTHRLQDVDEIQEIDFLKLDVQGSELAVLEGAGEKLRSALVVHTEVQFVPFYKGQPLFAELDQTLRAAGFYLHRFSPLVSRLFKPFMMGANLHAGLSQVLWSDAIYVRKFTDFANMSSQSLLKIALILHDIYGSHDLVGLALRHADNIDGASRWQSYVRQVTGTAPPLGAAPSNNDCFAQAIHFFQAGRLHEAEQLCRQTLASQPNHAEAMHLLGVIAFQCGRMEIAIDLLRRATTLRPDFSEAFSNLGNILNSAGDAEGAVAACRQAIALAPDYAEAYGNLGAALWSCGDREESLAATRRAIELKPDYSQAHYNLGFALHKAGLLEESIAAYKRAIALRPHYPEALSNLADVLTAAGALPEALAMARRAVELKPDFPDGLNNLGAALTRLGSLTEAVDAFRRALACNPRHVQALVNLGHALTEQGHVDEAISICNQAIALQPSCAEAYGNLGNALKDGGDVDGAVHAFRRALALDPNSVAVHGNLLNSLLFHPDYSAQAIAQEQRQWNQRHVAHLLPASPPRRSDRSSRRLRIGYVSPDFRDHVIGRNVLPLLTHHDRERFEVFAYSAVSLPDSMTERFRARVEGWSDINALSDSQVAQLIRDDRIDILVDLTLHLQRNRILIFARKPAPIQVTFAGYPGSTGLTAMDFRLSDNFLDPPESDTSVYSEKTIRLGHSFWCYDPMENRALAVNPLPAHANRFLTFGAINNFCKTNPRLFDLWAIVLRGVADSRLLLLAPEGSHRQRVRTYFEARGVAGDRIMFESPRARPQYLRLFHRVDVALDTLPYNGHTSSLDALWMGVPVITMPGQTIVGRAGVSQLMNLNLPEVIAKTPEQYVSLAVEISRDLDRLAHLRSTLRARMGESPLMDAAGFARDVETAYLTMWDESA